MKSAKTSNRLSMPTAFSIKTGNRLIIFAQVSRGNGLETERLPETAQNGFFAVSQPKTPKANYCWFPIIYLVFPFAAFFEVSLQR
jgi:hypothetical protein